MSGVAYSRQAERHIRSIGRRLEREAGLPTALKWVRRLRKAAAALPGFPDQGALDPDVGRRRLVVRPYLIFYDVAASGDVLITAVIDGRRDLPKLFTKPDAV